MTRKLSIGLRLTLWYVLIFAAAQLIFGIGMWAVLRHNLYDIADDTLEDQIDDVRSFLEAQKKNATVAKLQEEVNEAYVLEHSGKYLQIRDSEGNWIYQADFFRKNNLSIPGPGQLQKPFYEDLRFGHRPFRFLSEVLEVNGRSFVVQTGIPEGDTLATLILFRRYLFMAAPFVLVTAAAVGYWLSRRALAPVDALTKAARNITGSNLGHRLEKLNTGDELQRLSDTLNEMLGRIEASFLRVTQFTADASHELRTPISLIRTEAEIALRKSRDVAEYREALEHILFESERTSSLIEKLLALARADAGRESLDIQKVDLRDIVLQSAEDWRRTIAEHHLQFVENILDRELYVSGDKSALQRVANILLDNAVKYTPARGSVQVCLEQKDGHAIFSVRDTGIGIPKEDRDKVFERFYRADKARTRERGGTGLGLAIAKWIVDQHQGSISVESTLGEGSLFVVELQLSKD
jgi:heavy metal sensor kinase